MKIRFLKRSESIKNKNLVIVRAGENSLHRNYFNDKQRNWDRMLFSYTEPNAFDFDNCEFIVKGGLTKWTDLSELVCSNFFDQLNYDFVLVADDDVLPVNNNAINLLFSKANEYALDISQPSLSHDSFYSWIITLQSPAFHVRYTNFVECMCPVFSRKGLFLAKDAINLAVSGCGLDLIFSELFGNLKNNIGIIDDVTFKHTKPIDPNGGAFYKHLKANGVDTKQEIINFMKKYNLTSKKIVTLGGVVCQQNISIANW